jgi:uncharacterized protein YpbB
MEEKIFKKAKETRDLLDAYDWIVRGKKTASETINHSYVEVTLRKNLTDHTIVIPSEISAEFIDMLKGFLDNKEKEIADKLKKLDE